MSEDITYYTNVASKLDLQLRAAMAAQDHAVLKEWYEGTKELWGKIRTLAGDKRYDEMRATVAGSFIARALGTYRGTAPADIFGELHAVRARFDAQRGGEQQEADPTNTGGPGGQHGVDEGHDGGATGGSHEATGSAIGIVEEVRQEQIGSVAGGGKGQKVGPGTWSREPPIDRTGDKAVATGQVTTKQAPAVMIIAPGEGLSGPGTRPTARMIDPAFNGRVTEPAAGNIDPALSGAGSEPAEMTIDPALLARPVTVPSGTNTVRRRPSVQPAFTWPRTIQNKTAHATMVPTRPSHGFQQLGMVMVDDDGVGFINPAFPEDHPPPRKTKEPSSKPVTIKIPSRKGKEKAGEAGEDEVVVVTAGSKRRREEEEEEDEEEARPHKKTIADGTGPRRRVIDGPWLKKYPKPPAGREFAIRCKTCVSRDLWCIKPEIGSKSSACLGCKAGKTGCSNGLGTKSKTPGPTKTVKAPKPPKSAPFVIDSDEDQKPAITLPAVRVMKYIEPDDDTEPEASPGPTAVKRSSAPSGAPRAAPTNRKESVVPTSAGPSARSESAPAKRLNRPRKALPPSEPAVASAVSPFLTSMQRFDGTVGELALAAAKIAQYEERLKIVEQYEARLKVLEQDRVDMQEIYEAKFDALEKAATSSRTQYTRLQGLFKTLKKLVLPTPQSPVAGPSGTQTHDSPAASRHSTPALVEYGSSEECSADTAERGPPPVDHPPPVATMAPAAGAHSPLSSTVVVLPATIPSTPTRPPPFGRLPGVSPTSALAVFGTAGPIDGTSLIPLPEDLTVNPALLSLQPTGQPPAVVVEPPTPQASQEMVAGPFLPPTVTVELPAPHQETELEPAAVPLIGKSRRSRTLSPVPPPSDRYPIRSRTHSPVPPEAAEKAHTGYNLRNRSPSPRPESGGANEKKRKMSGDSEGGVTKKARADGSSSG